MRIARPSDQGVTLTPGSDAGSVLYNMILLVQELGIAIICFHLSSSLVYFYDHCFILQSSKTDECLFSTERINKFYYIYRTFHNSQKNSNTKKYIALNRKGKTRKHVLKMHRSARFNVTQNLEPPIKLLPPERYQLLKPKPSKKGRKDIRLRSGLKSGSKFYKRPGTTTSNNKKSRRRQKKKQRLSQILKSIELSLRRPTSASHANFADSLLLDYGGVNPFTNSATGDAIRHSSNKIYKSKNPKRTYKRKSSSSEG